MNLQLNTFSCYANSFLKEGALSSLTPLQKKIIVIAVIIFTFLGGCLACYRRKNFLDLSKDYKQRVDNKPVIITKDDDFNKEELQLEKGQESSIIFGKSESPTINHINTFAANNNIIAYITKDHINYLDTIKGEKYSFKREKYSLQSRFEKDEVFVTSFGLACIDWKASKVDYFQPDDEHKTLRRTSSFDFSQRRPSARSEFFKLDHRNQLGIVEHKPFSSDYAFDGHIDILDTELQKLISIVEKDKDLKPVSMVTHQDILYVGYDNYNLEIGNSRGNYDNFLDCIKTYSLRTQKFLKSYPCSFPRRVLTDGNFLIVNRDLCAIDSLDLDNGNLLYTLYPESDALEDENYGKQGYVEQLHLENKLIFAYLRDFRIKIWSASTGNLLQTIDLNRVFNRKVHDVWGSYSFPPHIKWTIHGQYIAIMQADESKKIHLFDVQTGLLVHSLQAVFAIADLKFNQEQLIATLKNGQIQIWDWDNIANLLRPI